MMRRTTAPAGPKGVRCAGWATSSIPAVPGWILAACILCLFPLAGKGASADKLQPILDTPADVSLDLQGFVGERLRANLYQWELRAPLANPAMIQMFRDRDRKPGRNLLPWSGEFVGKYLCAAVLSYRILKDAREKENLEQVVKALIESQGPDGYLGPFNRADRLTGQNWDLWGHYWVIRGLLMYYQETGYQPALESAERAADLIVATFLNKDTPFTNDGSYGQMNYAVIHALALLYRITGKPQYLGMAAWIRKQWDMPGAGLYMRLARVGKEMYEFPGNRWESLHDFLGMYEMYLVTGDAEYRQAFTRIWYSILKGDRHNTGGFTSGEHTTGNPYDPGAIETCSTVAWIDMSIDMLKLQGDPRVADELELSTYNGNIGGQSPSGSWWTYNTPMDGVKEASAHTINFQCRPGSPELNCCSVNGPRGLGLIAEWAVMKSAQGLVLNYYGPGTLRAPTLNGQTVTLKQTTRYPVDGKVTLQVDLPKPEKFGLKLRIPSWSRSTGVWLNGQPVPEAVAGSYLNLERQWQKGDTVEMVFDMSFHYWAGEREDELKASIYRGPILLAFDPAYNTIDPAAIPELDSRHLSFEAVHTSLPIQPLQLLKVKAVNGTEVTLCDYPTAGAYGNRFRTWFPILNLRPTSFDPARPVWNNRPE
jgi:uncharacterized protein